MKERIKIFLCGVVTITFVLIAVSSVFAVSQRQVTINYNDINVTLNGEELLLMDSEGNALEAFMLDGTTYLPIRAVSEAVGLSVNWNQESSTVELISPENKHAVYITRTGAKYHYNNACNNGVYWEVPLESALGMGLKPCEKCIPK